MCTTVDDGPIRRARRAGDWSITELAASVGVSSQHLYRVEANHAKPSKGLLGRLSDVLSVPIAQLDGTEPYIEPTDVSFEAGYRSGYDAGFADGFEQAQAEGVDVVLNR